MIDAPSPAWGFPNKATALGSSAYYSCRFTPARLRPVMALLYAWRHQVRAVLRDCSDPGVARMKLQWWREELARGYLNSARHPLMQALAPHLERHALPQAVFLEMTLAVEAEIVRDRPADLPALMRRCDQDQGALFELAGRCHSWRDADIPALRRVGAACTLASLIRDFGALLRRDYQPIPPALSDSFDLSDAAHRGALETLTRQARRGFDGAPLPPGLAARAAILASLLDEIEHTGYAVINQRIGLTPLRKLWIGWRASRRALRTMPRQG